MKDLEGFRRTAKWWSERIDQLLVLMPEGISQQVLRALNIVHCVTLRLLLTWR